jgi:hypothetical protein
MIIFLNLNNNSKRMEGIPIEDSDNRTESEEQEEGIRLIPGIITFKSIEGIFYDFHCDDLIKNSEYFKTILESTDEKTIEINEKGKYLKKLFLYFKTSHIKFETIEEVVDMWKLGHKWLIDDIIVKSFDTYIVDLKEADSDERVKIIQLLPSNLVLDGPEEQVFKFTKIFTSLDNREVLISHIHDIKLLKYLYVNDISSLIIRNNKRCWKCSHCEGRSCGR